MNMIAILLGMSLDVGGVGGLLSGIFAKSFKRAMLWSAGFGALNVVLLFLVSPTSRFTPIFMGSVAGGGRIVRSHDRHFGSGAAQNLHQN